MSHRKVPDIVRVSPLRKRFVLCASFLQDGLMAESCHVQRVYLVLWKKHRDIRESTKILYLTRLPKAYCT